MRLQRFIISESVESDLLKKLNQWKKDLRKMTKLYKSLEAEESPGAIKKFKVAHKYWITFCQNWESWYMRELLKDKGDRISVDIAADEKIRKKRIQVAAWGAMTSISNLFPTRYDFKVDKHVAAPWKLDVGGYSKGDTRKNKILVYQKAFREAFDAIEDHIKHESENVNVLKATEQINVSGVNVLISGVGADQKDDSWNLKHVRKFIKSDLPKSVDLIKKSGIKQVLRGLTIEVTLSGSSSVGVKSGAGGSYNFIKDWLRMYPLGLGRESVPTIIHELGHRYYYRHLPEGAQNSWYKMFHERQVQIKDFHIEGFMKKYGGDEFNKKSVIADIVGDKKIDPSWREIYLFLAHNTWVFQSGEGFAERFAARAAENIGEWVPIEFITDYARTNPAESFAETFKLWVTGKVGRLGPWTREFFKDVVRSGGANIREEELINKYL